eukprot:scaffold11055_cov32-Tisochrysis_lutea.AAC.2
MTRFQGPCRRTHRVSNAQLILHRQIHHPAHQSRGLRIRPNRSFVRSFRLAGQVYFVLLSSPSVSQRDRGSPPGLQRARHLNFRGSSPLWAQRARCGHGRPDLMRVVYRLPAWQLQTLARLRSVGAEDALCTRSTRVKGQLQAPGAAILPRQSTP